MASYNRAELIGHLGKDPEVRWTPNGQAVANFSLATNERWKDRNNQVQERTEWHRVVAWGKLAEVCGEHLEKGKMVMVTGRLQTREWDDKQGVKHYSTEIVAQEVIFLSAKEAPGRRPEPPAEGSKIPPRGEPNGATPPPPGDD